MYETYTCIIQLYKFSEVYLTGNVLIICHNFVTKIVKKNSGEKQ